MIRGRSKWLADIINTRKYTRGAEVGVAIGLTTGHVLLSCPTIVEYIVADDWRPVPGSGIFESSGMKESFLHKYSKNPKLTVLEGVSWKQADKVEDASLDFCFIDASHDLVSVLKDLKAWAPKVKPGGMLCGHDAHWNGVKSALKELYPAYELAGIDNVWYQLLPL